MEILDTIIAIITGLTTCIPLVITLIKYIQAATKEKNWSQLMQIVTNLMAEAEHKFDNGKDRKEWVIISLKAMSNTLNYDIDWNVVDDMIEGLVKMSSVVNSARDSKKEKDAEVAAPKE